MSVPFTVAFTAIVSSVATHGTVTVSVLTVAEVTVALAPPIVTVLSATVGLKLRPVRVADAPGTSGEGLIEVMAGPTQVTVTLTVAVEPPGTA